VAEDHSLWIMGVSDHDRNTLPLPLQVETDYFPISSSPSDESTAAATNKNSKYFHLSPHDRIFKGHNKVIIYSSRYYQKSASDSNSSISKSDPSSLAPFSSPSSVPMENLRRGFGVKYCNSFEVMLHQGEAFVLPVDLEFGGKSKPGNDGLEEKKNNDNDNLSEEEILSRKIPKVRDYSVGWKHELLVLDEQQ
jgi:hypothetical protein